MHLDPVTSVGVGVLFRLCFRFRCQSMLCRLGFMSWTDGEVLCSVQPLVLTAHTKAKITM